MTNMKLYLKLSQDSNFNEVTRMIKILPNRNPEAIPAIIEDMINTMEEYEKQDELINEGKRLTYEKN